MADTKISDEIAAGVLDGTEIVPVVRGSGSPLTYVNYRSTSGQIAAVGGSPGGRLTLLTGVAVMTSDQTAKPTIYYRTHRHNRAPVAGVMLPIGGDEISMGLDAGVPHVALGSVYDVFAINDSGTLVIVIGPAWSSTTTRGTGAGTTELALSGGIWTNANSLTNAWGGASGTTDYGPIAANAATYLGSFYATANGQTGMAFKPTPAAGGTNNFVALYNAYNRVLMRALNRDSSASWTTTSTTWQTLNNGASSGTLQRITWLDGLGESPVFAQLTSACRISANANNVVAGIIFDATTGTPSGQLGLTANTDNTTVIAHDQMTGLGLHFAQGMQRVITGGTGLYNGQAVTNEFYTSISAALEM